MTGVDELLGDEPADASSTCDDDDHGELLVTAAGGGIVGELVEMRDRIRVDGAIRMSPR